MVFDLSSLRNYSRVRKTVIPTRTQTVPIRTRVLPTPTRSTFTRLPAGSLTGQSIQRSLITSRPATSMQARPSIVTRSRIDINGGIIPTVAAASGIMPSRSGTAAASGGGLPALSGGGFDLGLGAIGGQIGSSVTGIVGQIRNLIPLAIKIIMAVIIVKIVLWLVRGRRR